MRVWDFIQEKLQDDIRVLLLWVVESEGSSPGRRGFKMAVAADGDFDGTIGGGIMEHKLVEKARSLLDEGVRTISLLRQYHDKSHKKDQSGMICSGSQVIAFVPLGKEHQQLIETILAEYKTHSPACVRLNASGLSITPTGTEQLSYTSEANWLYAEKIDRRPVIHIVGAGHVGLALSELMAFLEYYVKLYDNRENLSTMKRNTYAHEKHIVDYDEISSIIEENTDEYLVIMTFGYRDDKRVFQQLVNKQFFYKGMMGSESKIDKLRSEFVAEGITDKQFGQWHMPIGINIYSKTTKEIAVSIAAEIIKERNKDLPTGRKENT